MGTNHDHEHSHAHPENEQLALLEYMLHHNEHHLEDFSDILLALKGEGECRAAAALEESINCLKLADKKLADAIAALKKEE